MDIKTTAVTTSMEILTMATTVLKKTGVATAKAKLNRRNSNNYNSDINSDHFCHHTSTISCWQQHHQKDRSDNNNSVNRIAAIATIMTLT